MMRGRHDDCPLCHTQRGPYFRPGQLLGLCSAAVTVGAVLLDQAGLALAAGFVAWLSFKASHTYRGRPTYRGRRYR